LRLGFAEIGRRAKLAFKLELENVVVQTICSHDVMNVLQQLQPVAGDKIDAGHASFLQLAARIKCLR
jgi:hypothetical protein